MSRLPRTIVSASFLTLSLGASHCERGDDAAFAPDVCLALATWESDPSPGPAPVVEATRWFEGLYTPAEVHVEVTACSASLTRTVNGATERIGPLRIDVGDARALHDELAAAGAGDLVGRWLCGWSTGHDTRTEITFYEPSLVPGRTWSNRFAFGNCAADRRAEAVAAIVWRWAADRFGDPF